MSLLHYLLFHVNGRFHSLDVSVRCTCHEFDIILILNMCFICCCLGTIVSAVEFTVLGRPVLCHQGLTL